MIESGFINGDCMDYLKEYPDNYFDLCIADPPYGDAMKSGGGVEQIRSEVQPLQNGHITPSDSGRKIGITRTGGTWATKYAKKL